MLTISSSGSFSVLASFRSKLIAVVLAVGVMLAAIYVVSDARQDRDAALLRADSVEAALDHSRVVRGVLADSLMLVTRRAVQSEIQRDSLDRKLKVRTRATADVSVHIPVITADSVKGTQDYTRLTFDTYERPFTIHAEVSLADTSAAFNIRTDTASLHLRLTCEDGDVKKARAFVSGPDWLNMNITGVQQDPVVCNAPLVQKQESRQRTKFAVLAGAAILIGILLK